MAIRLPSRSNRSRRPRTAMKPVGSIAHIAARIFNTPLLIHQPKLEAILAVLGSRLGLREDMIPQTFSASTSGPVLYFGDDPEYDDQPDNDQDDECAGVTVIPVHGTLVQRGGLNAMSGMTSYDALRADFEDAMNDPDCKALVLDFDSPGGEVSGMFELANIISSARGTKPIIGVSNEAAFSAAYALAACCTRLLVGQTGGVGSIGCYMLHCDQSGYDEQKGLSYTYIYSGDYKTEGNPHEPLSKDAKADLQAQVDKIRDMFVQTVARNRGMDAQKVYDTQAKTYMGSDGVNMMLADDVGTLDDALELAQSMVSGARSFVMPPSVEGAYRAAAAEKIAQEFDLSMQAGAVPSHKTATSDKAWDGPANEARLKSPMSVATAKRMYAWYDSSKVDSGNIAKSACSLPHHEVSGDGDPGAANVKGCQSAIGALNGARGGSKIPAGDRRGTYNHLAKHLKDAGVEPPPLKSEAEAYGIDQLDRLGVIPGTIIGIDFEDGSAVAKRAMGSIWAGVRASNNGNIEVIRGILAPYNSLSCDLGGFREIYQPGCFAEFLKSGEDACVFGFHNPENVLGRISSGTARFWEEADGLHYEADLPDTQFARDLKTLIDRGDVKGSSAAFFILQHRWEQRSTGRVRIIEKAKLVEGSPHSLVAYESSTAQTVVQEDQLAATHEQDIALARARRLRLT